MLNLLLATTRLAARPALRSCLPLPRSALPSALAPSSARLLSSTPPHWATASLGAGSGKGGKADKEKAAKDKAAAAKQREKERAAREKARAKEVKLKEKERAAKAKAKEKALKEKEKDKLAKEKKKAKEVAEKAKAKPLTKSLLHPPKAPQNAWQIFAAEYIQERRSSATPGEKLPSAAALSKEAAPLYRELDSTAKAELLEKANAQRLAYPDILASYIASLSPAQIKEENAIRSRRRKAGLSNRRNLAIPGAPKRPLTGYMQFVGDVRKNRPEVIEGAASVTEQSKLIAAEWKALTEEQRKEYNDAAIKAREEYVAELAKFEQEAEEKSQ